MASALAELRKWADVASLPGPLRAAIRSLLGMDAPLEGPKPTGQRVIDAVIAVSGVDASEFYGTSRHERIVLARGIAAMLLSELTGLTAQEQATLMHRPNRSTIITALHRTQGIAADAAHGQHLGVLAIADSVRKRLAEKP